MKFITLTAIATTAVTVTAADNEQIVGSFMFQRHGDRLKKPTGFLTPVGEQQTLDAGKYFHNRYFHDDDTKLKDLNRTYTAAQVYAQVPNSDVLQHSHMGFLQGFYPPLTDLKGVDNGTVQGSSLNNGGTLGNPLGGYQYVTINGIPDDSPSSLDIQGDSDCPVADKAKDKYLTSDEFYKISNETKKFYESLENLVGGKDGLSKDELNYGNAYGVFDYMNVNNVHDKEFHNKLNDGHKEDFDKVRYLADLYSKKVNYNKDDDKTIVAGRTLAAAIKKQLNETKSGGQKVTLFTGSYATFYQLFGVLDMYAYDDQNFTGLVDYSSVAAFELVKKDGDLNVRFVLRNGTGDDKEAKAYPMFNTKSELMPYDEFTKKINKLAITDLDDWCSLCKPDESPFCTSFSTKAQKELDDYQEMKANGKKEESSLTLPQAGGIGAGVTIGVFAIIGALAFLFMRNKKPTNPSNASYNSDVEKNPSIAKESSSVRSNR